MVPPEVDVALGIVFDAAGSFIFRIFMQASLGVSEAAVGICQLSFGNS
jgi:hypothetical protein